ncbi:LAGLIDADG family homing endonuclease [Streptomyces sp. NRRL F-2664]|uniref:LAGLIDADG family homing endonuclease n=1 Tax=Streptomyces sp. NRRL F-2664 TaxID=1463842 RepID=UPI0004CA71E6|nr:LAGLIDADG family homing endonuclease [Streptomyces sp. NRRL F-2664]
MADQDPNAPVRFMDLQDPRYAYMFGFLQADGHLAQGAGRKGKLTAEVNVRDIEILRAFQHLTPYYSSITQRTRATNFSESHASATWNLCALEARNTLNELGLPYGPKSRDIRPPRVEFSRRDYLRGVIDADGSVGYTSTGLPFVSLTTASTALGAYLCHFAKKITGAERTIRRNARDGIYNILYTKEAALQLASHLYYGGCLGLERKKAKVDEMSRWVRPADMRVAPPRRRWSPDEDALLVRLNDPAAAALALERTAQSCAVRLWRLRTAKA